MKRNKRIARDGFGGKKRSRSVATEGWRGVTAIPVEPPKRRRRTGGGEPGKYDPFMDPMMGRVHRDDEDVLAIIMAFLETR
jgi:hypothetical protein